MTPPSGLGPPGHIPSREGTECKAFIGNLNYSTTTAGLQTALQGLPGFIGCKVRRTHTSLATRAQRPPPRLPLAVPTGWLIRSGRQRNPGLCAWPRLLAWCPHRS